MDDIAKIAEGLTEAQRELILNARDQMSSYGGYPFFTVDFQSGEPWPEGVAQFLTLTRDRLTPLGLAVRNHLSERM